MKLGIKYLFNIFNLYVKKVVILRIFLGNRVIVSRGNSKFRLFVFLNFNVYK